MNRSHIGDDQLAKSLCVSPTHFEHRLIGEGLKPLLDGCDGLLLPGNGIANVAELDPLIKEHGITSKSSVPTFWKEALRVSSPPQGKLWVDQVARITATDDVKRIESQAIVSIKKFADVAALFVQS